MHDDIRRFLADARNLSLDPAEREAMRGALHVAQAKIHLILTPDEKADGRRRLGRHMHDGHLAPWYRALWSSLTNVPALASIVLTLVGTTGSLAYAAEQSIPGDLLYPIKLHVTEKFISELQRTPVDQAQWAVIQLQRRFDEARKRRATPTDDAQEDQLAHMIEEYADNASNRVAHLTAPQDAAVLQEQLRLSMEVEKRKLQRQFENKPSRHLRETLQSLEQRTAEKTPPRPAMLLPRRVQSSASSTSGTQSSLPRHRRSRSSVARSSDDTSSSWQEESSDPSSAQDIAPIIAPIQGNTSISSASIMLPNDTSTSSASLHLPDLPPTAPIELPFHKPLPPKAPHGLLKQ